MRRIIVINPDKPPKVLEVPATLKALQEAVGGYIELFAVDGHVNFLCNEEGRLIGMPFNRSIQLSDGAEFDIYGPVVLLGGKEETGEFESLTDTDIAEWMAKLGGE